MQTCTILSCWTELHDLNSQGECVWWSTGLISKTKRFCSRIALPSNLKEFGTDDHGYIRGEHINKKGKTEEDSLKDSYGNVINLPKICAYDDPFALQLLEGVVDPMDKDPYFQPNHKTPEIDKTSSLWQALGSSLSSSPNKAVNDSIGCVIRPIGPNPPPYYKALKPSKATITVERICEKQNTDTGYSKDNDCVLSDVENNFIHNAIRVGFDDALPLCDVLNALDNGNRTYLNSNSCVDIKIQNDIIDVAALAHDNNDDSLPLCKNNAKSTCVNIQPSRYPDIKKNVNVRVLYGVFKNNTIIMNDNGVFDKSKKDEQKIWGVNLGDYEDIVINLDNSNFKEYEKTTIKTIKDRNGKDHTIEARILLTDSEQYRAEEICAKETGDENWHCFNRAKPPKPQVYSCNSNLDSQSSQCENDSHFRPHLIAQISIGSYKIQGVIEPYNETSQEFSPDINISPFKNLNIAGKNYTAFVTDKNYNTIPFTGDNASKDGASLHGTYKDNKNPAKEKAALYLTGMEYNNLKYKMGGHYICLMDLDSSIYDCSINKKNCVLAKNLKPKEQGKEPLASNKFEDRIWPRYEQDASNDLDNRYFDYQNPYQDITTDEDRSYLSDSICNVKDVNEATDLAAIFDIKKCSMRSKTAMEHNLCIEIPKLECPATSNADETTGYAVWSQALAGEESIGKCLDGYEPATDPLKRFCIINFNEKKAMLEPISNKMICTKSN